MKKYQEEYDVAAKLGWKIDESQMAQNGPSFIKHWTRTEQNGTVHTGEIHIWKIREGWMCANLNLNKHFCNHRQYPSAVTAMQTEAELDKVLDEIIEEILQEENDKESK